MQTDAWLKQIRIKSDVIMDALTEKVNLLDTKFPWEVRIRTILKQEANTEGLYITGPVGCGKHTLAACAIDQLRKGANANSEYLALCGTDLLAEGESLCVAEERLNALLDDCFDNESDLYLILENVDDCADPQGVLNFLGYTVHLYKMHRDDYFGFFLILVSDNELTLPSILRDALLRCRVDAPSQEARCTFFEIKAEEIFPGTVSSIELLSTLTAGYSYSDMENLATILLGINKQTPTHHISDEELAALVEAQRRHDETQQSLIFQTLTQLTDSLNQGLERIAAKITAMPTVAASTAIVQPALQKMPDPNAQKISEQSEQERIAQEGFGKQVVELFGDRGTSLLQNNGYDFNNLDA